MTARYSPKLLTSRSSFVLCAIIVLLFEFYELTRILTPILHSIPKSRIPFEKRSATPVPSIDVSTISKTTSGINYVKNYSKEKNKSKSSILLSSRPQLKYTQEIEQTRPSDTIKRSSKSEQLNCKRSISDSFSLQPLAPTTPQFLRDYAKWHAEQRKCLADPSCKKKPKVLVSRCPRHGLCLGLGDRIRGVFFSFWLAVITERVFFIDWPKKPYALPVGMVPSAIDWTLPSTLPLNDSWPYLKWNGVCSGSDECGKLFPTNADMFSHDGTRLDLLTDNLEEKFGSTQLLSIFNRFRPQLLTWISKNPHYAKKYGKYTKSLKDFQDNRAFIIPALFQPSEETMKKMKPAMFADNVPYMALHIRAGKGKGVQEDTLDRFSSFSNKEELMVRNLVSCLSTLREAANGPKRVFLASDSEGEKELARNLLRKNGYEVKEFNSTALHVGRMRVLSKEFLEEEEKMCDSYLGVYADLFMMARADYIVSSGSHFTLFAEMLSPKVGLIKFHEDQDLVSKLCLPSRKFVGH